MLMFDRLTNITEHREASGKGEIVAEMDVHPKLWFLEYHFKGDPVMLGCLGLDAMWQMLGFFLAWMGEKGRGRALGVGQLKFTDQVLPTTQRVIYKVDVKRLIRRKLIMAVADARLELDGKAIYDASDLKVGLFNI